MEIKEFNNIINDYEYSIVHFDAKWDGYRKIIKQKIDNLPSYKEHINFMYIDIDESVELSKILEIPNVPVIRYYKKDLLISTLIGAGQDVEKNINDLLNDRIPNYNEQQNQTKKQWWEFWK